MKIEKLTAQERDELELDDTGANESRAEALQARVAELEAELKASRDFWVGSKQREIEARIAAESELADLRGRARGAELRLVNVALDDNEAREQALEALRGR